MSHFNGMCYQPFPPGYDPSTANNTCIFFGSDIAYAPMAPIWGNSYTSATGSSCGPNDDQHARNDLQTLSDMGVSLLRLYDWEPRNDHLGFLDACQQLGIQVLVPVSNYFVRPDQGLPQREQLIPSLIKSFSNKDQTDYHPAVKGIIIGNEPEVNNFTAQNCIDFTKSFVEIESSSFGGYREVIIGHPVDFGKYGGDYPCFGFWDPLLASLNQVDTKNLNKRLFLAPQCYVDKIYLYQNAEASGTGYVDLAYDKYQKPILFTEIGSGRFNGNYQSTADGQLSGSIAYQQQNPDKLIGICFFQFADKVWLKPTDSEATFGAYSHSGQTLCTIDYNGKDFTHWEANCDADSMAVDVLTASPLKDIVVKHYKE